MTRLPHQTWHARLYGRSCNGQATWIRDHILPLGRVAWQGYLTEGRGLVACQRAIADSPWPTSDYAGYLPAAEISLNLQAYGLEVADINALMPTVHTYCPEREILLFIAHKGHNTISLLTDLAITPVDCYQQMSGRWDEFYLDPPVGDRA